MKKVYIKTYKKAPNLSPAPRTFEGFSEDYSFDSITSNLNSGYGALTFSLPRKFDVLQPQDPQNLDGYELDVVAYDSQKPDGVILFSGEVVSIERALSGDGESIHYTAISPLERLEKIDLEDTDAIVTYTNVEIATIFRNIIDQCNAKAGEQVLKYTASSIATTGKTISINFENAYVGDALKAVFQTTNSGWVWYVDVDKTVYLKQISTTPDHYFFNTKDVSSIARTTDKSKVVNVLKFWNGDTVTPLFRRYFNQASISAHGYRAESVQDSRYTQASSALELGKKFITDKKAPNDQFTLTIIDSSGGGFDIDQMRVGDTFKLLNFTLETNIPELLVITSKTDYLDYCTITASDRNEYVARELVNLKKEQYQVNNTGHPSGSYTTIAV